MSSLEADEPYKTDMIEIKANYERLLSATINLQEYPEKTSIFVINQVREWKQGVIRALLQTIIKLEKESFLSMETEFALSDDIDVQKILKQLIPLNNDEPYGVYFFVEETKRIVFRSCTYLPTLDHLKEIVTHLLPTHSNAGEKFVDFYLA
ncbi:unnamed protein product [Blepharisma stoltei]|uniref:Uncharacterized protein n=1 Tax=Blepharisma stoltei TaxID=1481888 RepID=A0AAU9I6F7_9CILI|nr:unnamed protein product [Blepharisma stoltei]